jgi:ATP-dependent Lon protease
MTNNNIGNEILIDLKNFKESIMELNILCTSNSLSNSIHCLLSNLNKLIDENCTIVNNQSILNVLKEICPKKISNILKIFNIDLTNTADYLNIADSIFKCISVDVKPIEYYKENSENYYEINRYLASNNIIPYAYFNTNIPNESRVVTNKNDKKENKNTITLKIKNEDLNEDLLSINLLIKLPNNKYILNVKAYVVNDSYATIRNDNKLFIKFFKHNYIEEYTNLYNKVHLRDCCLNSLNGEQPFEYIKKVYDTIRNCNFLCNTINDNKSTDKNKPCNECKKGDDCNKTEKQQNVDFVKLIKNYKSNEEPNIECIESAHYIQKFAKYCFHTKYLVIVHTAEYHPQVCLFLALILVRCNNRLCREFLDTLPYIYKKMIMESNCIGGYDESKTDININDKEPLSDKIIFWKSYTSKYGLNLKKLIDKCNELCKDDDNKNSGGMFGDNNGEKERTKKMVNYLEKISSGFFLLNIHNQLIKLIEYARDMYSDSKINSLDDINKAIMKKVMEYHKISLPYEDIEVTKYKNNLNKFKQSVIKKILNMSEGQLSIKKSIYQYIIDFVTNPKPLTSRKILCLVGPPGVGKTYISLCIARILFFNEDENPTDEEVKQLVYILSIPGITNENALLGSNAVYVGAQPGVISKELLFLNKLCRKLIIFDEIDKESKYIEQLIPILDYTQNDKIVDNYFDIELDMRACVLIATANDKNNIHPILKDRLHIIEVSGYSNYTKSKMVQTHIMTKLLSERSIDENLIHIPIPVLELLINDRTREAGVRKLKELITDIISYVKTGIQYDDIDHSSLINNINMKLNEKENKAYYITDMQALQNNLTSTDSEIMSLYDKYYNYNKYNIEEFYQKISARYKKYIKSYLIDPTLSHKIILTKNDIDIIFSDRRKINYEHIDDIVKWEPGKVIGLYATTMGLGGILPISIKLNKSLAGKKTLVTLAAQETMKDSAMISTMLVSDYIINMYNNILNKNDFKLYFGIDIEDFKLHLENIIKISSPHIILDSSTPKDGPSAGGAFMIAYLSKILNHELSNKVAITGEISSNLKITAIGGLNMKINGAMHAGCRSIVSPIENIDDVLREIVYENSIDVKNEHKKRLAFIYYCEKEQSYILLVRSSPSNEKKYDDDQNIKLSAFDINVDYGKVEYLNYDKLSKPDDCETDCDSSNSGTESCILVDTINIITKKDLKKKKDRKKTKDNKINKKDTIPTLFKIKLNAITDKKLIDPVIGLNKVIITTNEKEITLADIMRNYFLVLSLDNINEIYYYMVMSKYIFDPVSTKDKIIYIDTVKINEVEFDGIKRDKDEGISEEKTDI